MRMYRSTLSAAAVMLALLPGAALADACKDALGALNATYRSENVDDIATAARTLRSNGACNDRTVNLALSQAAGVMAGRAARLMPDDIAGAEAILAKAPGLHWAVQSVRADIAAARDDRYEAAQLYNAALDTITDPALTPPTEKLIPHAERLAKLAQENMMLAGTLMASVTRGGATRGVLKSAVRGIVIEAATGDVVDVASGGSETATPPPTDGGENAVDIVLPETLGEGEKAAEDAHEEQHDAVIVDHEDPYAGGKEEDFAVADGVAKATKTVFLPIRFATDSHQLDSKGVYEAEYVGAFLKTNKIKEVTLIGHTDETGPDSYNLDLSLRRAQAVREFLTQYGVQTYIGIDGRGEHEPPVLSDPHIYSDDERRAISRRVELVLHR